MKNSVLKTAIAAALGVTALAAASVASAGVTTADWTGYFVMLDSAGSALANTSITAKGANQYVSSISGTMSFDDVTGAGTATLVPFDFFGQPASATGIEMQAIGDGMGGPGTLVLGNMLFNWNSTIGIPVSLVMDASGYFAGEIAPGGANSATPATDGTYINASWGYLTQGPMPMVTTAWNTTLGAGCTYGDCVGVNPSGTLPLVLDTATNSAFDGPNDGGTIGGNPMQDGGFIGSNANFQVATFSNFTYDANAMIAPHCDWGINCPGGTTPPAVPVPAAAWLFGSGLLGLVGVARRRNNKA